MERVTESQWINAIAERLSDEWSGKTDCPEDAVILKKLLRKALLSSPESYRDLIGTGIIEEDYFTDLS